MLKLHLLGPFEAVRGQEAQDHVVFPDETVHRLCKFLALHPDKPLSPDVLSHACWPGAERPDRAALYVVISRLRQCLQPTLPRPAASDLIRRHGSSYMFSPGDKCQLDYAQYGIWAGAAQGRAVAGDWQGVLSAVTAAEQLVRGELLACEAYTDWAEDARRRFRQDRADLLELGLSAHARLAQWTTVIVAARRLLALDNTRESAYRHLMAAYAATGEHGLALASYDECRRALTVELGVDPSPATIAVYTHLLSSASGFPDSPSGSAAPSPPAPTGLEAMRRAALGSLAVPMAGRQQSLSDIPALLAQGALVVLTGEPGVGKSRLAAECLGRMAAGTTVLAGACQAPDRSRPFQPLAEALGPLWPDRGAPGSTGQPLVLSVLSDSPDRLFASALTRLKAEAQSRCVVVVLDDLHLADTDTITFLHSLVPHLGPQPGGGCLAVLATARTAELQGHHALPDLLAAARRRGRLRDVAVTPLSAVEVTELVSACAAEPAAKTAALSRQLHEESGGIALFAVERIRALLESGQLSPGSGDGWRWPDNLSLADLAPPDAVQDLARQRTKDLSPSAHSLLQASLALQSEAPFAWLAALASGSPSPLLDGLDELLARRVLFALEADGKTVYSVGHHLIREALYRALPDARRRHLHRAAGRALARLSEHDALIPPALVARQFQLGGEDGLAVQWHLRAGARAKAAAALSEAIGHVQQAVQLAERYSNAALTAACSEELAGLLAAVDGWTGPVRDLYATAFEQAPAPSDRTRIALRWSTACLPADPALALAMARQAEALARDLYDREYTIWALGLQAAAHHRDGKYSDAKERADAAVAEFNRPDPLAAGRSAAPLDVDTSVFATRHQAIWEATQHLRAIGHTPGEIAGYLYLADVAAFSAHQPDTEQWAQQVLALTGAGEEEHALAQFCLAWVASSKGDLVRCLGLLRTLERAAVARQWPGILMACRFLLAAMLAEQGQVDGAHTINNAAHVAAETEGDLRSRVWTRYIRAYIHWCAGEPAAARDWVQMAMALGEGHLQRMDVIHLRRTLGVAQFDLGEWQAALELAEANIVAARAAGMALDEALAIGLKGRALVMLGERPSGRDALIMAIQLFRRLGAERLMRIGLGMLSDLGLAPPNAAG